MGADLDPWNNIFGEWGVVHALPWWRVWLFRGGAGRRAGVLNKISAILLGGLAARLIID